MKQLGSENGLLIHHKKQPPSCLPLKSIQLKINTKCLVASIEAVLEYYNDSSSPAEVEFVMPMDSVAVVTGLSARLEGRVVRGEVKRKEEAKDDYDDAVSNGHTAAVYGEQGGKDIFRMLLGNLPAGGRAELKLSLLQEMQREEGDEGPIRFSLPTTLKPRYCPAGTVTADSSDTAVEAEYELSVAMTVEYAGGVSRVESPSHLISTVVLEGGEWKVQLIDPNPLEKDFVILLYPSHPGIPSIVWGEPPSPSSQQETPGVSTHHPFSVSPALMLSFLPQFSQEEREEGKVSSEVILMIDCSGSMRGEPIASARSTLELLLRSLAPGCAFNVVGFGTKFKFLFPEGSRLYDAVNLRKATEYASQIKADMGGTEMLPPLVEIFRLPHMGRLSREIIILTNGAVNNTELVLRCVREYRNKERVFAIGIGSGVSIELVRGIAEEGGGRVVFMREGEQMKESILRLLSDAMSPCFTDVEVKVPKGIHLFPGKIPRLFSTDKLVIYGLLIDCRLSLRRKKLSLSYKHKGKLFSHELSLECCEKYSWIHKLACSAALREWEHTVSKRNECEQLSCDTNILCVHTELVDVYNAERKIAKPVQLTAYTKSKRVKKPSNRIKTRKVRSNVIRANSFPGAIQQNSMPGVTRVPPAIPRSTRVPQTGVSPTAILKQTAPFRSSLSECGNSQTQAVSDTFQKVTASNKSGVSPPAIPKKTAPFRSSLTECGNSQTQAVSDTFQKVTASNKSAMRHRTCKYGLLTHHELQPTRCLTLKSVSLSVNTKCLVASIEAVLEYYNDSSTPAEVEFVMPMDSVAVVTGLSARLEGRVVRGEVKRKEEAKDDYDDAVSSGHTAVYGEQGGKDIFRMLLGNLPAGGRAELKLSLLQEMQREEGDEGPIRFSLPTTLKPRYCPAGTVTADSSETAVEAEYELSVAMTVEYAGGVSRVESPSHLISTVVLEGGEWKVQIIDPNPLEKDFVILLYPSHPGIPSIVWGEPTPSSQQETPGVSTHHPFSVSPALMLSFLPQFSREEREEGEVSSEVIFMIDCSGSMRGEPIVSARSTLELLLRSLSPGCAFNVVGFGTKFKFLFPEGSRLYDAENLRKATEYASQIKADMGGTEMLPPLVEIYPLSQLSGLSRQIILLTDGAVGNTEKLLRYVRNNRNKGRVFAIGLGSGVSTELVRGMAEAGGGRAEFVLEGERMQGKVLGLLSDAISPCLTHVELKAPKGVHLFPNKIPQLFTNDRLVVYGLVDGSVSLSSEDKLSLSYQQKGKLFSHELSLECCEKYSWIHKLACSAALREWEHTVSRRSECEQLSCDTNLVCVLTALVGVDTEGGNVVQGSMQHLKLKPPRPEDLSYSICGSSSAYLTRDICAMPSHSVGRLNRCVTRVPPAIPRSTRVPQTGVFPTAILKKTAPFHSSLSECGNSQTQAVSDTFQKVTASNKSGPTHVPPAIPRRTIPLRSSLSECGNSQTQAVSDTFQKVTASNIDDFNSIEISVDVIRSESNTNRPLFISKIFDSYEEDYESIGIDYSRVEKCRYSSPNSTKEPWFEEGSYSLRRAPGFRRKRSMDEINYSTCKPLDASISHHEQLISQQTAEGYWEFDETVSKLLDLSEIQKEACPKGMSEREWITLLCLITLEKYTEFEDEWKLVVKKGWRWLRGCQLTVNLEEATETARKSMK